MYAAIRWSKTEMMTAPVAELNQADAISAITDHNLGIALIGYYAGPSLLNEGTCDFRDSWLHHFQTSYHHHCTVRHNNTRPCAVR